MKKTIFGFVGQMGSGKGTAAAYLKEKYSASTYQFSRLLRDILARLHLPAERSNLQKTSEILREAFGETILARVMAEDIGSDRRSLIAIEGIRRTEDCAYLFKLPEFVLIEIFADLETRLKRINARNENPDDATLTLEQFKINHGRSPEKSIAEIAARATERIDNNGTNEELEAQLDALIKKYQG